MYYFYIFLNKKHFKNQSQSHQFLEGSGIWNEKIKNKKFHEAQLIHKITL